MEKGWFDLLKALPDEALPFASVNHEDQLDHLIKLGLTTQSTAEDARRTAVTLRLKFQESGIDAKTFEALGWALNRTRDAMDPYELLQFMLNPDVTFSRIETDRQDFR